MLRKHGLATKIQEGDGFIIREMEPQNLESPASAFSTFLTPTERFYVRSHFKQPELSSASWSLTVDGAVSTPLNISYADLLGMTPTKMISMLECAGNGRVYLVPKADGAQWANGGMGNAEWTGVPVAELLKRSGLKTNAVDVVFEGSDAGEIDHPCDTWPHTFCAFHLRLRSTSRRCSPRIPDERESSYCCTRISGTRRHTWLVRHGVGQVVKRITVTEKPFDGYFQSLQYSYFERPNGVPTLLPITEISVKSAVMHPAFGETISASKPYKVAGVAWAGLRDVASVEVSTDDGKSWFVAQLTTPAVRYSWRMWEFVWTPPRAGSYKLMARAKDSKGNMQPMERNKDLAAIE